MLSIAFCVRLLGNPKVKKKSSRLNIKFGKPILEVSYEFINILIWAFFLTAGVNIFYSGKLMYNAIYIRNHVGYYIDLISKRDGNVLPLLQALPSFIFLIINLFGLYLVLRIMSSREKQPKTNWMLYFVVLLNLIMIGVGLILVIVVLIHSYGNHQGLHDGIKGAMKDYGSNEKVKSQIDRLQIDLQCCGSKKYDEWYDIKWYDSALIAKGSKESKSQTPFSCCSMKSLSPCIHYDIEETGSVYTYTPEYNLSISTVGCFDMLKKRKQNVGWGIIGKLLLGLFLQALTTILVRFIQTGHFEKFKFEGRSRTYIIWLFGLYTGRNLKKVKEPPEPPPLPPELEDSQ
ncbi:rod outer segment membrane protein 1-like [Harmonia axyridis]|uniref:rod outer segment membrane protein 1-like n=1 Tax=Harmonia axyridis TaxID=115357 RepID=UPI001E275219|nr:rod outer segment membrane protein 1-like [Harmonia axyridis]